MRFVSFRHAGTSRAGVLLGDGAGADDQVLDLAHPAMADALAGAAPAMAALIAGDLRAAAARISAHGLAEGARLPLSQVELLAPYVPERIYALAFNYRDALEERGMAAPAEPVLFMKHASTVVGPGTPILLPPDIGGCTYEVEIAAVIGRRAEKVDRDAALGCVAAYAVFNDISASEMIKRDGGFTRGKNLPTFGPLGPFLATADEIADPHALALSLDVDGTRLQDGVSSNLVFDVADLVSWLSHRQPLETGDLIATGTPAGVAGMRKPPAWLKPGTVVRARVEGLGTLVNPIAEGAPHGP
ncbi:fumarylacetoacetate hydrolase family protein [Xanthobacter sp. KR7-65]|uniref:fumarylacetoacetate hydrolase family protein n=1 Tax=Xanthobacter sp. KR7-65 TaxID=3156612 RepID=UPI0032B3F316